MAPNTLFFPLYWPFFLALMPVSLIIGVHVASVGKGAKYF
ncbi:DUF3561 family protein [Salmonella enterica subsp. enterica]|nr:DUF3561 family protein [Salmonella enterica subsp. enterica]